MDTLSCHSSTWCFCSNDLIDMKGRCCLDQSFCALRFVLTIRTITRLALRHISPKYSDFVMMEFKKKKKGKLHHQLWQTIFDYFFYIFTFDFHILPEYRRIGGRIFPSSYFNNKNSDHPASMRSVLTHLLRIETVSKLLNCDRKSRNYVHSNTYYCKPELISWQ